MLADAAWQNWFMSGRHNALLEAMDTASFEAIDFTKELIAIPTENPPGNDYARCAAGLSKRREG